MHRPQYGRWLVSAPEQVIVTMCMDDVKPREIRSPQFPGKSSRAPPTSNFHPHMFVPRIVRPITGTEHHHPMPPVRHRVSHVVRLIP